VPAFAVLHFDGDEAPLPGRTKSLNKDIEGRSVAAETKVAPAWRVFNQDFGNF
jgi:hypothetical protein